MILVNPKRYPDFLVQYYRLDWPLVNVITNSKFKRNLVYIDNDWFARYMEPEETIVDYLAIMNKVDLGIEY